MVTHPNVKINLGLAVLHKREDGYHDLKTLFVPYFGIHDTLEIVTGDEPSHTIGTLLAKYGPLPSDVPEGYVPNLVQAISPDGRLMITIAREDGVQWDPLSDLTAKAYFLLSNDYKLPPVKVFLEKTSPVGAGLGGGSSDAAFALGMISTICGLDLDKESLGRYASRLGSDCAFFVYNSPMLGEGRGEMLHPHPVGNLDYGQTGGDACEYLLKVLSPEGIAVSTAQAYRGIVPRDRMEEKAEDVEEALARPVEEWRDHLVNDFEKTVFAAHPELAAIKESLYASGAVYAAMSGSGSALFGIYRK